MPVVTPCATPRLRQIVRPRPTPTQRAFNRHYHDVYEAPTYLRIGGVWTSVTTPTQDQLAAADMVLQGGHQHVVTAAVAAAIQAAGLCLSTIIGGYSDIYTDVYIG